MRCSTDVEELYLAHSDLNSVHSLASYKSLHILWLNANRVSDSATLLTGGGGAAIQTLLVGEGLQQYKLC